MDFSKHSPLPVRRRNSVKRIVLFVWMVNGFLEAFTTAGPPEE